MSSSSDLRSPGVLETKAPALSTSDAERVAWEVFGVRGAAHALDSERDQNFKLFAEGSAGGGREFVLKVANPAEDPAVLDLQTRALLHIAARDPTLPVPRVLTTAAGAPSQIVAAPDGRRHVVRLLSYLPGAVLEEVPHPPQLLRNVGATLARLGRALRGFFHPAAGHELLWDLKLAARLREHALHIEDAERRRLADRFLERFETRVLPGLPGLRAQVIHSDVNCQNTLVDASGERVAGIVDFGDMVHAPLVNDVAVTVSEAMLGEPDPIAAAAEVVAGYHAVEALHEEELALLFDLVAARLAVGVTISAWRVKEHPENRDYIAGGDRPIWAVLERLAGMDPGFVHCCFRAACGLSPCRTAPKLVAWLGDRAGSFGSVLELELRAARKRRVPADAVLVDAPDGPDPKRGLDELLAGADVGLGAYRERRGGGAVSPIHADERRTLHLGIDLFVAPGTEVRAALDGAVHDVDAGAARSVILEHAVEGGLRFYTRYGGLSRDSLEALRPGARAARGERLGRVGDATTGARALPHLHFQIVADLLGLRERFPRAGEPSKGAVWQSLSPDPNLILGIAPEAFEAREADVERLLERRARLLGPALTHFYDRPLHVVRAQGAWLIDVSGRAYLDAYNNVPHVGHCHPAVVQALARQAATLNTNTRYLYESVLDYAERLADTMPGSLQVSMFVNSGSEANDLAWRLAKAHTGQRGAIVVAGAYHGATDAVNDLSPYETESAGELAPHVRAIPAPDGYRGVYRRDEARLGERYAAAVDDAIASLRADGLAPAAFFLDTLLASSGIVIPPAGYLGAVFARVRAAGGLCVADEVQAGFGRTGEHMWGFEAHEVVPDIVTLGKPIGNGHPVAAVVTTPEIVASLASRGEFFSTFGGNPVSCAAGLAVLDVIEREGLRENARKVGAHLRAGLDALAKERSLIGDVRGAGLFAGVELVRDRATLEPAEAEARAVMNHMRDAGVLVGLEGPLDNVLKIRPPLVFTEANADQLLEALDRALAAM
jgi:4-aminobutyrate aminotransferase-like enzyme/Ser/Thr protein kinase RdoA (MazF antagonist)